MTTRLQRSGYKFLVRRLEQAFVSRDSRGLGNPFVAQTSAVAVGFAALTLVMIIGLLVSIFKPKPDRGIDKIITTQSGGMYVMYDDTLHPVTNLASARLIVGEPGNSTMTKNSTLEEYPRGPLMGIPSAPNSLDAHADDPATWTVCDRRDVRANISLTNTGKITTTIIAGHDMLSGDADVMNNHQAILARSATAPDKLWLLFNGHRAEIGRQDFATHSALGLTPSKIDSAIVLSGGLIDAIDVYPTLTIPFLNDRGKVSETVPDHVVGDIITIGTASGDRNAYVVVNNGVQRVTPVVAALLINTGSRQQVEENPEKVTTLPQVQVIDTSRYPETVPDILDPTTTCFSWARGRQDASATTKIVTGDALPLAEDKQPYLLPLLTPNKEVVQADASAMDPGLGWYVRVTGSTASSLSAEQLMFIDDTGTRYFISPDEKGSYDPIVKALGLNWQAPMPIPWAIAKLYVQGSTLSREDALVQHAFIPPNLHGVPAPPKPGKVSEPEPGQ